MTATVLPPVTPGEILYEEFMVPMGLSATRVAKALSVPVNRVTAIVKGERAITADTALRLASCFGTSAEFWTNLQTLHDLEVARRTSGKEIEKSVTPLPTDGARGAA
jgi:addiction module HigA family antidote